MYLITLPGLLGKVPTIVRAPVLNYTPSAAAFFHLVQSSRWSGGGRRGFRRDGISLDFPHPLNDYEDRVLGCSIL